MTERMIEEMTKGVASLGSIPRRFLPFPVVPLFRWAIWPLDDSQGAVPQMSSMSSSRLPPLPSGGAGRVHPAAHRAMVKLCRTLGTITITDHNCNYLKSRAVGCTVG